MGTLNLQFASTLLSAGKQVKGVHGRSCSCGSCGTPNKAQFSDFFPDSLRGAVSISAPDCGQPFARLGSRKLFVSNRPALGANFGYSSNFSGDSHRGHMSQQCVASTLQAKPALSSNDSSQESEEYNGACLRDFTRFFKKTNGTTELQTAIVTYWKRGPWWDLLWPEVQVDLVAAVHIGDKEYFELLQEELSTYDRVLYEMVADKSGFEPLKNGRQQRWKPRQEKDKNKNGGSIIGMIQRFMSQILELDFQLECMDYRGNNWYHADLDLQTFQELQKERGETFFSFARDMAVSTLARMPAGPSGDLGPVKRSLLWAARFVPMPLLGLFLIEGVCAPSEETLLKAPEVKALMDLDLATALKVVLAKQITQDMLESNANVMESSVIIGERNLAAMKELELALAQGCRRVAVFYGSGHLPDLHRRITKELGMRPVSRSWRTAWNISGQRRVPQGALTEALRTLARTSGWRLNRYETTALLLFSLVLACDLWVWELLLESTKDYATTVVVFLGNFFDQGWGL